MHATSESEAPVRRPSLLLRAGLAAVLLAGFAALGVAGLRSRAQQQLDRDGATATTIARIDKPRVLTVTAERAPTHVEQVLPGTAVPLLETAVYSRTSGYLKRWLVNIGDRVEAGQLMAEIETPEVDAQLLQARATLNESQATLLRNRASEALAKINRERTLRLVQTNAVSQQEFDDADATHKVAAATIQVSEAMIKANEANVKRLVDLQCFQKVTAPFAGVVTARNFDPGALIVADNAAAKELFHLSQINTLRVEVDVPQIYATAVKAGQPAPVFRREMPGRDFPGVVARSTNSVDPHTRTLRVEVDVPNPDGLLLPGMYLQVRFRLEAPAGVVRVPGAAVITRAEGAKVAVIDSAGTIQYRPIQLGRDFGTMMEVTSGLSGGETLVMRPGDDLPEGTAVEPVAATGK